MSQCYVAIELEVAGAVDLAHPAGADEREDLVGPEAAARGRRIGEYLNSGRPMQRPANAANAQREAKEIA